MLETILLALVFAKFKKYKIHKLFLIWQFYIILGLELVYLVFQINFFMHDYSLVKYVHILKALYLSSYILLIIRCKLYKSALWGAAFIALGSICNEVAISANGGKMPVFPSNTIVTGYVNNQPFSTIDTLHILGGSSTNLIFLTDIFDIGYAVLSIGDIFIRVFVFIIIYNAVKYLNENPINNLRSD